MQHYLVQKGERTPYVQFTSSGALWIKGYSFPTDASSFYEPLLQWMTRYAAHPASRTVLTLDLESFNIGSSKYILYLIYHLQELARKGYEVSIEWVHEEGDEEMMEVGADYEIMAGIPFHYVYRSAQRDLARKALASTS